MHIMEWLFSILDSLILKGPFYHAELSVYLFKLDTFFFLNNSTNTHRRPAKRKCNTFLFTCVTFQFFDLFALLSTLTYLDGHVTKEMCGSPPGVMMADTLSFNAKIGLVDF